MGTAPATTTTTLRISRDLAIGKHHMVASRGLRFGGADPFGIGIAAGR